MYYKHPLEIPKSTKITNFEWTGERKPCPVPGIHNDTHPMTWAADGEIYLSAGDPNFIFENGKYRHMPWKEAFEKPDIYPHMGGLDVEKLTGIGYEFGIEPVNTMPGLMGPGGNGPKPSGMISVKGSLYLAVQNLLGKKPSPHREKSQHGSDATILRSDDNGETWYPDIQTGLAEMEAQFYDRPNMRWLNPPEERTEWKGWNPMFTGWKFGGPSFVQFGRDNAEAVDDYVYAISGDQWDNGSQLRLGRVPHDDILNVKAWEWANVQADGQVKWNGNLDESQPVLIIEGHLGLPEMVYLPSIRRYFLLTWALHKDFDVAEGSELTILEAEQPWGPFKLVYYEENWDQKEVCPYCPRVPLKWFDPLTLSGWILHSGNWHSPEPYYKPLVRPFRLEIR
jgi:hypothetical protein